MDAYLTIKRQEGVVGGLYRGTVPNIGRNCIINVGETVVYDAVKVSYCSKEQDNIEKLFIRTVSHLVAT